MLMLVKVHLPSLVLLAPLSPLLVVLGGRRGRVQADAVVVATPAGAHLEGEKREERREERKKI